MTIGLAVSTQFPSDRRRDGRTYRRTSLLWQRLR